MELRVLKYFLVVAREENITRAASLLHVTQPTLSRQLMQLEEELGVKLFHRSKYRIILTDDGILLHRRAQRSRRSPPVSPGGSPPGASCRHRHSAIAFPSLSNSLLSMVQDAPLASNITVKEMFMATQRIVGQTWEYLPLYLEAGFI